MQKTRAKSGSCMKNAWKNVICSNWCGGSKVLWIRCLLQGVGWSLLAAFQSHLPVSPVDFGASRPWGLRMLAHFWSILGHRWTLVKRPSAFIERKLMPLIDWVDSWVRWREKTKTNKCKWSRTQMNVDLHDFPQLRIKTLHLHIPFHHGFRKPLLLSWKKLTGLTFHRSSLSSHSTTSPNRPLRSGRTWLSGPVRHRVKSKKPSPVREIPLGLQSKMLYLHTCCWWFRNPTTTAFCWMYIKFLWIMG